jgi:hypothetical protein
VAKARSAADLGPRIGMRELLGEALRSPRDLLAMVAVILAAMVLTAPLPTGWWAPAALLLAAVPGTMIMNRVRLRTERRARGRGAPLRR